MRQFLLLGYELHYKNKVASLFGWITRPTRFEMVIFGYKQF